ncbi:deaminase [Nitriliruptoraceae bacterium ZYF776]|nr:deaminase [Profundirhabdus halotolerans]
MGKLIYSMITSLDGYTEATEGDLGRGPADDEEVHRFIGDTFRHVGTYLYGRRMYETMVFWETADQLPDAPEHVVEFAHDWQAADKVVYSTTLPAVTSQRTRLERRFDADAVRELKAASDRDLTIDGPTLAAQAVAAGLVDEYHLFVTTTVVGGGRRFFPDGVRLELDLVEQRVFDSGLLYARYHPR